MLAPEAVDRCLSVLRGYRQVMDKLDVVRGRLAATSAARDASNGAEFLRAAGEATGIEPELLVGTDEGRLSMAGAVSDLDHDEGPFLVLDIGGGSTELVTGSGPDDPELSVVSLQVGCVRITERFLTSDPPTATELREAEAMVNESAGAGHRRPPPIPRRPPPGRSGRHRHHPGLPAPGTRSLRP